MGSFANTLFRIMLGWLQGAVSSIWSAFTTENGASFLNWIGRNWILIAGILCLIGLAADLAVYLVRWKPYKVWKSFFTHRQEDETETKSESPVPERAEAAFEPVVQKKDFPTAASSRKVTEREEEPDLSYWKQEEEQERQRKEYQAEEPAMVTKSGYVVPVNSPYRRPADTGKIKPAVQEEEQALAEQEAKSPAVSQRRRRIRVSELFSDPEEEIQEFDAPQHVIDARTAYHEPVYPRGWKKSEDGGK